ncbi:MAG: hypothetical protein ACO1QB_00455 [Verrucomicrobiales bacterium]
MNEQHPVTMKTAEIVTHEGNQAIVLSTDFRFDEVQKVQIERIGKQLVITPLSNPKFKTLKN